MIFPPASDYRSAFREDDRGTDVAILQMNLPDLEVDGIYGATTVKAVRSWQRKHKLVIDGIAGYATAQSIVSSLCRPVTTKHDLPSGLLKSVAFNESSFKLANAGRHQGDNGWDIGVFARSTGSNYGSEPFFESCFNVKESAEWTGNNLIQRHSGFEHPVDSQYLFELATDNKERFSWQLAVLNHNWPVGAENIYKNGQATSNDDMPAKWIEDATRNPTTGISRLHTPREWVMSYVTKATTFVDW